MIEPRCLASDTMIDTPSGPKRVSELAIGAIVWTAGAHGEKVAAPLLAASHFAVSPDHEMADVVLDDGRRLLVSPGHPTCAMGGSNAAASLGELGRGAAYDGAKVREAKRVPYGAEATFDILPAGETGCYWANGVLVGSTLR